MSDSIDILEYRSADKIVSAFPADKLIFWIGSGIDSSLPTSLPLGYGLTEHVLKSACGEYYEKLKETWCKNVNSTTKACENKISLPQWPRLETVIEVVREFESHQLNKNSMLEGLKVFSSAYLPPNNEHFLLADFLHRGSNIITTNYGDFICKAYEVQFGENMISHEEDQLHIYKAHNKWKSCIYHLHGVSSDLKTIGANLSNVKNNLPQIFQDQFRYWIENGYCIIFMGYGGVDSLDINPFLKSCIKGSATGIYIRHSNCPKVAECTDAEKTLLSPFQSKYVCPCITNEFFCVLNGYKDKSHYVATQKEGSWENLFNQNSSRYTNYESKAIMLGMCYRLGVAITSIFPVTSWSKEVMLCNNLDKWYQSYYSFQNATIIGDKKTLKKQGKELLKDNDALMKMDYQVAKGSKIVTIEYEYIKNIFCEIKIDLQEGQKIDWHLSTPLNRCAESFIYQIFHFPLRSNQNIINLNNQGESLFLMDCYKLIIGEGYNCVADVNQINTAYRAFGLCQMIHDGNIEEAVENINIALRNYADVSSMQGLVMTFLYLAAVWLIDYVLRHEKKSLANVKRNLNIAHEIILNCELARYRKRYVSLKYLYLYFKFLY